MAVLAINSIGLGVAQGIWSGLIIVVSFIWGVVVFKEVEFFLLFHIQPLKSLPLAILGVVLLCAGVFGMAISPGLFKEQYQKGKFIFQSP